MGEPGLVVTGRTNFAEIQVGQIAAGRRLEVNPNIVKSRVGIAVLGTELGAQLLPRRRIYIIAVKGGMAAPAEPTIGQN